MLNGVLLSPMILTLSYIDCLNVCNFIYFDFLACPFKLQRWADIRRQKRLYMKVIFFFFF